MYIKSATVVFIHTLCVQKTDYDVAAGTQLGNEDIPVSVYHEHVLAPLLRNHGKSSPHAPMLVGGWFVRVCKSGRQ